MYHKLLCDMYLTFVLQDLVLQSFQFDRVYAQLGQKVLGKVLKFLTFF